jgi:hypothetical protein
MGCAALTDTGSPWIACYTLVCLSPKECGRE